MKKSKAISKYFFLLVLGMLLNNCANQLPPGGGEIDRIPPQITELYPPDGTINFNDDYFEVTFSKYIEKRSLKDAIFISPALKGNLEIDWTGHSARINFPEKLRDSTTYVVTIGTDLVDYNNKNRMAESYTFSFSTGNKIDKRVITGKVYDEKPSGIMIFAYKKGKADPDPMKEKPDFISQAGNDGRYKIAGLSAGDYRVFAVMDEARDLLFQPGQDRIGMPYKDVSFSEQDTLFRGLNFFLTKIDTTAPRMLHSAMTDKYHIVVNFSEPIDSTCIRSNNFFVYDSTAKKRIPMLYAYKGNTKPTEIVLVTSQNIPEDNIVYLYANAIKDPSGNEYRNDYTSLTVSTKPDSIKPDISKYFPPARTDHADFNGQKFQFYFNDGVDSNAVKSALSFADTSGNAVNYRIRFIDDASCQVEAINPLAPKKDYIIKIDFSKFSDAAGNRRDSLYQYKFKTITGLDFTGISGTLKVFDLQKRPMIVLQGVDGDKLLYTQRLASDSKFDIERVVPGKYILWSYLDIDSSGTYSYGEIKPFKPAEEFSYYRDTLSLRARWVQTDIMFEFR